MGRLTDLVRRATGGSSRASSIARALALRVIDRAVSTSRRLGDIAEAVRPALGAASSPPTAEAIDVVPRTRRPAPSTAAPPPRIREPATGPAAGWTIARHVSTTSSAHAAILIEGDPWTETGHDPEMLRRIRVASRRLRVLVALFEPWLRPKLARRVRRQLRRLGRALGPVREWDVIAGALHARLQDMRDPGQAAAIEHVLVDVTHRRVEAREAAREAFDRLDRARLRRDLDEVIGSVVAPFVRLGADPKAEAWALLRPRIEAAFDAAPIPPPPGDAEAVHAVRIHAKRLRYAYDLLAPAFDDLRMRRELKHVQRVIGDARDRGLLAEIVQRHRDALHEQGRPHLAAGLSPLAERLLDEAALARAPIDHALASLDRGRTLATTQRALQGLASATEIPRRRTSGSDTVR